MKEVFKRILLILLCVALPAAALAEGIADDQTVVHTDFTLDMKLHSGAFPETEMHVQDWETLIDKISLSASMDAYQFLQPDSRQYIDASLNLNGDKLIPFVFDNYGADHYLITPALRNDPVLFHMTSYFEFMLKPYYFLRLPTNMIGVLTYPAAVIDLAKQYYTPLEELLSAARQAALSDTDEEHPAEIRYTLSFAELLTLCDTWNAVAAEDTQNRLRWFLNALLAEFYIYDVVLEVMSHFELMLAVLDPGKEGMQVIETEDGITCTLGGRDIFIKTTSGDATDIAFMLPLPDDYQIALSLQSDVSDGLTAMAAFSVTEGEEDVLWLTLEGSGLPAEGVLAGDGDISIAMGGREFYGAEPGPQTFHISWSRTAEELPYTLDAAVDWLHPDTGLGAFSVYFSGAFAKSDLSVFNDQEYPELPFFGLNTVLLEEFKASWGRSILAHLVPVALEMPRGVIDDIVDYLLDSDILISLMD